MSFADKFRETYRTALHAARANDREATLAGLSDLYRLFAEQYALDNGDSIVIKAKLSYWQEVFGGYVRIIREYGLGDRRVQKFFGLSDDVGAPSLGDILEGKGAVPLPPVTPAAAPGGGIDISGIADPVAPPAPAVPPAPVTPPAPAPAEPITTAPVTPAPAAPVTPSPVTPAPVTPTPVAPAPGEKDSGEAQEPTFAPDTLAGFIGQQHIVKALLKEIAIAKAQGRKYLDNILLFGNPGLGKTTLMQLIAKELGVRFEWMDCSQYRSSRQSMKALQNFLLKVARDNEPVVIAFDEIHMLPAELQSSLLTLLNSRVYVSPPDEHGVVRRYPIENFTFIAATTDDNEVLGTIKDRCLRLKFQLVDYTPEELKRIYKNKVASKGLTITDEAIDACIPRSRGSIRYVNSFVSGLDTALYDDDGRRISTSIDADVVERFFREKGIDAVGLEKKDLEILRVLADGAMGVDTLSARIGMDPKKYLSEYEPYLIKIGFVAIVTGRGRSLTEKAINYLKEN